MCNKNSRYLEFFEKDLKNSFSLFRRIHIWFSKQNRMFIWRYFKLRKSMLPQQFHIIIIFNNSMFNGVLKFKHSSFATVNVIPHVNFRLITGTGDDDIIFWSSYAELNNRYTDGMIWGFFYYPLNPTFR